MSGDFFNGNSDRFKGVTVISKDEPCPEENFDAKLKASLEKWENEVKLQENNTAIKLYLIKLQFVGRSRSMVLRTDC